MDPNEAYDPPARPDWTGGDWLMLGVTFGGITLASLTLYAVVRYGMQYHY